MDSSRPIPRGIRFKLLQRAHFRRLIAPLRTLETLAFRLAVRTALTLRILTRPQLGSDEPKRILIVHISSHIGDTVMLLPMIEALREAHPSARLDIATEMPMTGFLRLVPALDHVYSFDLGKPEPTATPWQEAKRSLRILYVYWQSMRSAEPDVCIVPRWGCGFRDLMVAYLTQAHHRIGFGSTDFDRSPSGSQYRDTLLTMAILGAAGMTDPQKFLFLVAEAGLIPKPMPDVAQIHSNRYMQSIADSVDWAALAARLGLNLEERFVIVAPGASAPRRMWPPERWAEVIRKLHAQGCSTVLLSGSQDATVAQQVHALLPAEEHSLCKVAAGATTLIESAALLSHAALFLGSDSGPGHMAGALGVSCIILFIAPIDADPDGPSAPERIRPMGKNVVCFRPRYCIPPCTDHCRADMAHCILKIDQDQVIKAVASTLA